MTTFLICTEASRLIRTPRSCPAHSHFESCGSMCRERCNEELPLACPLACYVGCVCDEGYVMDKNDNCVKREDCPAPRAAKAVRYLSRVRRQARCGPNEHYTTCGTACEPTCGKPLADLCTMECVPDVCQCNPGFFRHATKGCVRQSQC
ncbi:unnamed protein product [Enterobius vermicularis]|uniref:TIL domain-containing protein n=1 Tax=Enterobius vermicularis TaxID=51028 RepID=A0A3P6HR90_ENTVE|nr:unnamed protein product [Enterobius vermicularis]